MKKGISRIEILVMVAVIFILVATLLALRYTKEKGNQTKCRSNLHNLNKCLELYKCDYGREVYYPDANGGELLARLYKVSLLMEPRVYICASTSDEWGNNPDNIGNVTEGDSKNSISYSGRKNKYQKKYPGFGMSYCSNWGLTPMVSDDWQGSPNHESGRLINFLFLDGHCEYRRYSQVNGNDYDKFKSRENDYLADPLTN